MNHIGEFRSADFGGFLLEGKIIVAGKGKIPHSLKNSLGPGLQILIYSLVHVVQLNLAKRHQ